MIVSCTFSRLWKTCVYPMSIQPQSLDDKVDEIIWNEILWVRIDLCWWNFDCQWITSEVDGDAIKTLLVRNMPIPNKILVQIFLIKYSKTIVTPLNEFPQMSMLNPLSPPWKINFPHRAVGYVRRCPLFCPLYIIHCCILLSTF